LNKVIITNDFEKCIEEIEYNEKIIKDELKIEDVSEIKHLAYIAEKEKKIILIAAKKYNIYAQNALLKILEESPKNIEFIILTTSKYLLLDTILSRLSIEKRIYKKELPSKEFVLSNENVLKYLKDDLQKEEVLSILKGLLKKDLNSEQLKIINDAILMLELNIDTKAVFSLISLSLKVEK